MLQHPFSIYDFSIKSYDSDQKGKLTLHTLFHFLQECAWDNARLNNFGYEYLKSQNAFWVLTRILVQIDEYPDWRDEVRIKTWPKGTDGFFALRDFEIYKDKRVIGKATTSWLILDAETKRPRKLDNFNFVFENFLQESAIDKKLEKVAVSRELIPVEQRKVYYSDLDVNKHVNNATYVKWILDSLFSESEKEISAFEINFISELHLNDEFIINKAIEGTKDVYMIKSLEGKEICRARVQR
mgnify:CR=1 FL=1